MRYLTSKALGYYEAADDIAVSDADVDVPQRPSSAHQWTGTAWTVLPAADIVAALGRQYGAAIQMHLDAFAQAMGYDSIHTAVTYADEPAVPQFQADGRALRAWRSRVWSAGYALLAASGAGLRPAPTIDQLLAELPAFQPLEL